MLLALSKVWDNMLEENVVRRIFVFDCVISHRLFLFLRIALMIRSSLRCLYYMKSEYSNVKNYLNKVGYFWNYKNLSTIHGCI